MSHAASSTDHFSHCEILLREGDPDRYFATLFAPADKRPFLYALYAFNFEVARVREAVREAVAGELRLQWWRDALQGEARGDVRANPVAAALDDTIARFRLPRHALVSLIDARLFDLYDDPMPSLNDLEGYCGETSSSLFQLASMIFAEGTSIGLPDVAGHGGVAYGLAGLLRAFPWHARRGQIYLPRDLLSRHGIVAQDIVGGHDSSGLRNALADLRAVARRHLAQADQLMPALSGEIKPAFRPLALVEPWLKEMEHEDYDPFKTVVALSPLRRLWKLWRYRLP